MGVVEGDETCPAYGLILGLLLSEAQCRLSRPLGLLAGPGQHQCVGLLGREVVGELLGFPRHIVSQASDET